MINAEDRKMPSPRVHTGFDPVNVVPNFSWYLELDSLGAFVTPPHQIAEYNFRVHMNDSVRFLLPAGALVNQAHCLLHIRSSAQIWCKLAGQSDHFGNLTFDWTPDEQFCGACTITVEYVTFKGDASKGLDNTLIIAPRLAAFPELTTSSLCMQTVLSRCMGTLDQFHLHIKHAVAPLNFNALHYTPLQVSGSSGSCYSIADQLQIAPTFFKAPPPEDGGYELLKGVLSHIEQEYGVIAFTDLVLNHTAPESRWLRSHPEAGFNAENSPHLTAAIELDIALQTFSQDIRSGKFRHRGLAEHIDTEEKLSRFKDLLQTEILNPFKLQEWFQMDVDHVLREVSKTTRIEGKRDQANRLHLLFVECMKQAGRKRLTGICPDPTWLRTHFEEASLRPSLAVVQQRLFERAGQVYHRIVEALTGHIRWHCIQCRDKSSEETSLIPRYFTKIELSNGSSVYLANNGWVMNYDVRESFAAPGSTVYLDRSLVVWTDCVKLRYGQSREDCPFLWDHMTEYCKRTARTFRGVRLDNCHSTPLHVAKVSSRPILRTELLAECRKVNPTLWVVAELFTGDRSLDLKFERTLGIDALVREAMQAHDLKTLQSYVDDVSSVPLGSLEPILALDRYNGEGQTQWRQLVPTLTPSILYDCTHDNPVPHQIHTAVDTLPNAAAVAAAPCAIGSSRGYDEVIPAGLSPVTEKRLYHIYAPDDSGCVARSDSDNDHLDTSAIQITTSLRLHEKTLYVKGSWDGWSEDLAMQQRHGMWVVALPEEHTTGQSNQSPSLASLSSAPIQYEYKFHTAQGQWFHDEQSPWVQDASGNKNNIISFGGGSQTVSRIRTHCIDAHQWKSGKPLPGIMEARKILNDLHAYLASQGFTETQTTTYGDQILAITRHHPATHRCCVFIIHKAFSPAVLAHPDITPYKHTIFGQIAEIILEAMFHVAEDAVFHDEKQYINGIRSYLDLGSGNKTSTSQFGFFEAVYDEQRHCTDITLKRFLPGSIVIFMTAGFRSVRESVESSIQDLEGLTQCFKTKIPRSKALEAFSYLLYSCSNEERDRSRGTRGCYKLANQELLYAGLAGCIPILDRLRFMKFIHNEPLIVNLLQGNWLFDYLTDRLDTDADHAFGEGVVVPLLKLATWIREAFREPLAQLPRALTPFYFDWIVSTLYSWTATLLFSGAPEPLKSARDPFISKLVLATLQFYSFMPSAPLIPHTKHPSLCAGLPHFSTDWMRNWGRDTFLSLEGILLVVGRYEEARDEILEYLRLIRHGLVPNLLGTAGNPRYNARDAVWICFSSIVDYCLSAPEGLEFLLTPLSLKYASDFFPVQNVADAMHLVCATHYKGLEFTEWNAGPNLDDKMTPQGFKNKIWVDHTTGLIHGGNPHNCGTWMDKMGSSKEAGNFGIPATPRDGAAIEINGLALRVLQFLTTIPSKYFPHSSVWETTTYGQWASTLQENLDSLYYVYRPTPHSSRVHIYKDTVGATEAWRDCQLRPNCCVALAAVPEAFPVDHALACLETVSSALLQAKTVDQVTETAQKAIQSVGRDAYEVRNWLLRHTADIQFTFQLGVKTLDPKDLQYRPVYNNNDMSTDYSVAHGFSYHNGPEWLWPLGAFLKSVFHFTALKIKADASSEKYPDSDTMPEEVARFHAMKYLWPHRRYLATDAWLSLPELTNANAEPCVHSSAAQAWSVGCILAAITSIGKFFASNQTTAS